VRHRAFEYMGFVISMLLVALWVAFLLGWLGDDLAPRCGYGNGRC